VTQTPSAKSLDLLSSEMARDYIADMAEELCKLAAKSGLREVEALLRLTYISARDHTVL